jgi:hypothetical protein
MIIVILFLLLFVAAMGYQKFRGTQALTFTHVDISDLTLEEVIAVGTKASGSLVGRLTGGTPNVRRVNDGAEWQAQIQGSVMAYRVMPLPNGAGYRVGGVATKMRIAQTRIGSNQGIWGMSKAMSNGLMAILGIPHNSPALVRRRNRVLRAVANAGAALPQAPAAPVASGDDGARPYTDPRGMPQRP